jgi:uncharacterized protein YecE (DUF72 family)
VAANDQLSLFGAPKLPPVPPTVLFGTSTWNYPGWAGTIYSREALKKGHVADLLAEYVRYPLFGTVGIDATFYQPFPETRWAALGRVLPSGFRCVSKVWERLTVRTFANVGGQAERAGERNPDYLNRDVFLRDVFEPAWQSFRDHLGPFVFELQACPPAMRPTEAEFVAELEHFLSTLPPEGRYAVELRDNALMTPSYFAALRRHNVAHAYNAWTRMPLPGQQADAEGEPTADFAVFRLLLKPGRTYERAVQDFRPYRKLQEPLEDVRRDVVDVIRRNQRAGRTSYVLVNNRLEGHAPGTIKALAEMLAAE